MMELPMINLIEMRDLDQLEEENETRANGWFHCSCHEREAKYLVRTEAE
jgi:hypothetical protein